MCLLSLLVEYFPASLANHPVFSPVSLHKKVHNSLNLDQILDFISDRIYSLAGRVIFHQLLRPGNLFLFLFIIKLTTDISVLLYCQKPFCVLMCTIILIFLKIFIGNCVALLIICIRFCRIVVMFPKYMIQIFKRLDTFFF